MQGSFNNPLNQLTGLSGGGIIPMQGKVSKPANVAVNGKASSLETNTAPYVFNYNLPVVPGTNNVSIVALDGSGNAKTNKYQIVVPGVTATSCAYDADGNCLSDGTRSYQWDALNRLIQITQGSNTYQFAYDGQSRRISETDNGTLTKQWVWVGNQMAEEQDGNNIVTKKFYPQGEQQSGTAYYYTSDHLGSTREMTDGSGTIQAKYDYDPFGRVTKLSGSLDSTFQYTGDYYHAASALNLTLNRGYDPNTGRWLSRDPIKNAEMRQGPNLYEYVQDDPILKSDPLGLSCCRSKKWTGCGLISGGNYGAGYGDLSGTVTCTSDPSLTATVAGPAISFGASLGSYAVSVGMVAYGDDPLRLTGNGEAWFLTVGFEAVPATKTFVLSGGCNGTSSGSSMKGTGGRFSLGLTYVEWKIIPFYSPR
jgi:RHS repeat-associated protein